MAVKREYYSCLQGETVYLNGIKGRITSNWGDWVKFYSFDCLVCEMVRPWQLIREADYATVP